MYMEIGKHGVEMAEKMEKILRDNGFDFYLDTPTNQKFVVLEDSMLEMFKDKVEYGFWEKPDDTHTVIRFAASWSTTDEDLAALEDVARDRPA